MIVESVADEPRDGRRVLTATVRFGRGDVETHRVWIRRPDGGPPAAGLADPLFACLLIPAMALGEELVIEAPVSADLLEAAHARVVPQLLRWHPRLVGSRVECGRAPPPPAAAPGSGTGCLFSLGVDSWHALLGRREEVTHLVHIHGFEVPHEHEPLGEHVRDRVRAVARDRGVGLIPADTNVLAVALNAVTDRLAREGRPWRTLGTDAWYGSMLVAIGLSARPALGRLLVPSSWSHHVDVPVASHPLMEPAWTTASLVLEIEGFDLDRMQKIRHLVESAPDVLPDLRVCVDTSGRVGPRLNCGRCIKCVRLLMELRVCGVRDPQALFSEPVDLRRAMTRRFHFDPVLWGPLEAQAEAVGDREVLRAVRVMADRRLYLPRLLRDLRRALRNRSVADLHWPRRRGRPPVG